MLIECHQPDHRIDEASGVVVCSDPECLVAAVHGLGEGSDPMGRLPASRPEWVLSSPARLDAREVDALAVLGDAGLIPSIVRPMDDDGHASDSVDLWPRRALSRRAG